MYTDADRDRDSQAAWLIHHSLTPAVGRIDIRTWQLVEELGKPDVTAEDIAAAVLAGLTPERIAALIPAGLASSVADQLEIRVRRGDEE